MKYIYDITPVAKPRMTQKDKWAKRKATSAYWAFKDECRLKKVFLPDNGASVTFIIPMPKSWPEKKRIEMNGLPHQQKPDIDNLIKSLADALYSDDSVIWDYAGITKLWGYEGRIIIRDE